MSNAPDHILARFAVSEDERGVILGLVINQGSDLQLGHLYQVENVLGELIIRDLGLSAATNANKSIIGWNHTCNDMVQTGDHLVTTKELQARRDFQNRMNL
jgi:hypothetical protein